MLNFLLISTAWHILLINWEDRFFALSDSIVLGAPYMQINSWYRQSAIAVVVVVFRGAKMTYLVLIVWRVRIRFLFSRPGTSPINQSPRASWAETLWQIGVIS